MPGNSPRGSVVEGVFSPAGDFTSPTAEEPVPLQVDSNGSLKTVHGGQLLSGALGQLPGQLKASGGTLLSVWVTNRDANVRYLQLFNTSSGGPIGGAVPIASYPVLPVSSSQMGGLVFGGSALFSSGIALGVSTTSATYTAATASETDWSALWS